MMSRRTFLCMLALGILSVPPAGQGQPAGKVPRIGWLATSAPGSFDEAFRQGLRERGYIEGQNTAIEWRSVKGDFARLPTAGAELLGLNVDIVVASGTPAALALQKLTTATPIVMVAGIDPVQARLVASLAHGPRTTRSGAPIRRRAPGVDNPQEMTRQEDQFDCFDRIGYRSMPVTPRILEQANRTREQVSCCFSLCLGDSGIR